MSGEAAVLRRTTTREVVVLVPYITSNRAINYAAVVRAKVDDDFNDEGAHTDGMVLQGHITTAVTAWVTETETGSAAWYATRGMFNVGDLKSYLDDPELVERLAALGVQSLEIVEIPCEESDWSYDEVLVDDSDPETDDGCE